MEQQDSNLTRRVVHLIKRHPQPKEIYQLITSKEVRYSPADQEANSCRDRGLMSMAFVSAGRISEITGGPVYRWDKQLKKAFKVPGKRHLGLQREELDLTQERILVSNMGVVKRSQKTIEKYGMQITTRDEFAIPLQRGLYSNPFWDQLVPFGWLILEYLTRFAPKTGKLFPFEDTRAYQIIREVTGNYPNWFRSQAEHFYGHYLLTDTVKLAKFVQTQDPKHVKHYIGYSWTEQLKDTKMYMDFDWINTATDIVKKRLSINTRIERVVSGRQILDIKVIVFDAFTEQEWTEYFRKVQQNGEALVIDSWSWNESWLTEWFRNNYKKIGFDRIAEQDTEEYNELREKMNIRLKPDFLAERKGQWLRVELECFSGEYGVHHEADYADIIVCYDNTLDETDKEIISIREVLGVKEVILRREIPEFLYRYDKDFRHEYKNRVALSQLKKTEEADKIWQ